MKAYHFLRSLMGYQPFKAVEWPSSSPPPPLSASDRGMQKHIQETLAKGADVHLPPGTYDKRIFESDNIVEAPFVRGSEVFEFEPAKSFSEDGTQFYPHSGVTLVDKKETVNHPQHYGGKDNPYEAIKVIRAWDLNFNLGSVLKHICRRGKKDSTTKLEDLKQALWYLNDEIDHLESELNIADDDPPYNDAGITDKLEKIARGEVSPDILDLPREPPPQVDEEAFRKS